MIENHRKSTKGVKVINYSTFGRSEKHMKTFERSSSRSMLSENSSDLVSIDNGHP
jgi:hypothetical protein